MAQAALIANMASAGLGVMETMQTTADWRMQGRNALVKGRAEALTKLPAFGLSRFKLSQLRPGGSNG